MNTQKKVQLEALFGPQTPYSDYKKSETITFREGNQTKQGVILWVRALVPAVQGDKVHPVIYIVDDDAGFPSKVYPAGIVEQ